MTARECLKIMRTGPIFTFNNSVPQKLFCSLFANVGSKFWLQGGCYSWLHYIPIANKSTGRTARDPVNVYLPGEEIPSPGKRKKVKLIESTSDTSGNYPLQGYQNGVGSRLNKNTSNSNIIKPRIVASELFHESMSDVANVRQRKFICLEGQRLVEEGFKAGLEIYKLFLRKTIKEVPSRLANFVEHGNIPVYHVSDTAIKNWSTLTTPPGIVGIFRKPKEKEIRERKLKKGMPVTVICDNVREPGNLGSILRSAAGAGCESVLLSKGCCDPWDSKVLRSGCGAQFYMPVIMNYRLSSLLDNIQYECGCSDTDEDAISDGNSTNNSSASGVVSESSPTITERSSPSFALLLADSNDSQTYEREPLPVFSYTDADYRTFKKIYLVVGGETEGLSRDILQIAADVKTSIHSRILQSTVARLRIPLLHNMESLNSSNAFSIIVYEMLRQLQSRKTGVS